MFIGIVFNNQTHNILSMKSCHNNWLMSNLLNLRPSFLFIQISGINKHVVSSYKIRLFDVTYSTSIHVIVCGIPASYFKSIFTIIIYNVDTMKTLLHFINLTKEFSSLFCKISSHNIIPR